MFSAGVQLKPVGTAIAAGYIKYLDPRHLSAHLTGDYSVRGAVGG